MIDNIIVWSLNNRLIVLVFAAFLIVYGAFEVSRAPVDVFPDLTAPSVTVLTEAHGMSPMDVEQTITFPIESALNGATGVRRLRSNTSEGMSVINVDFDWEVDGTVARQVVAERLQAVTSALPAEAEAPVIGPMTSVMGDILFIGLTSESPDVDMMELRKVAEWTIAKRLLAIPGVAQVMPLGGDERQYQVKLDPRRLDAYELTAEDVAGALEAANENMPAGFLVEGGTEQQIVGMGRVRSVEDIENSLVTMRDDQPIRVSDVATVLLGPGLKRGEGGVNGKRGIVIGVRKQPNVNTLKLTEEVQDVLTQLELGLPKGVKLHSGLFRQADFIEVAVKNVADALRDGSILVILIVLIFLASGRATFITAVAIPLSLLAAVLAMRFQGISLNTMTLGGMAIAVGVLVDDAIIDVENVVRRLQQWYEKPEADRPTALHVVLEASREIRRSIVFATFIIVLVFLPLFFLSGVEGRMLQPLGFAYVISLGASLVVALTVTPVLCLMMLPTSKAVKTGHDSALVRWLKSRFAPVLEFWVPRWKVLTAISLILCTIAGTGFVLAGRAFLPPFNEGALTLSIMTPAGTSLEESEKVGVRVEKILLKFPEVVSTARRTGRGEGDDHAQPVHNSEIEARLKLQGRSKEDFLAALRHELLEVRGVAIIVGQPLEHRIEHLISGSRATIAIKIFGEDLIEMEKYAKRIETVTKGVPGTADVTLEAQTQVPYVSVNFDRPKLARYGLTVHQVADEVATAFQGRVVSQVYEGSASFDLVVLYDRGSLDSLEGVMEKRIGTPTGARIPLHAVASIDRSIGPASIGRENGRRKMVVVSNVARRDVGSVVADIRSAVTQAVPMEEGYYVEYGGQFESAEEASRLIALIGIFVFIAIMLLLTIALGSVRDAVLVLVNLPLSLIGGVVGVYLSGGVVSIASLIGFITLFGIATRNGIMMVTHIQHLHSVDGLGRDEAVKQGALERLAPILMTALASGLGLLPLALAQGEPGSEIQAPMAVVILCGLVTSTALNMVVIPALYRRFGHFGGEPALAD